MKIAQNRYLRRKIELYGNHSEQNKIPKLQGAYNTIVSGQDREIEEDFNPDNIFSFDKYRREIFKNSACMGRQLQRYFEFNDHQDFAYYREEKGGKLRKALPTEEFKCQVQTKRDVGQKDRKNWDKNKETVDKERRLEIGIKKKKKYRYVYYYSNDPFEITLAKLQIEK